MSEVCEVCLRPRHIPGRWKPDTQCPREFPEGSLAGCLRIGYEREKERAAHFEALARNLATDGHALRTDQPAATETGPYVPPPAQAADRGAEHYGVREWPAEQAPQGAPRRILGGKGGQTVGLEPHWRGCPCSECDETRFGSEDKNPGEVV